jgi:hypothetical protein
MGPVRDGGGRPEDRGKIGPMATNGAGVLVVGGGLAAAGYFGYRYWQRQQMAAAAVAAAEEARARGMSLKDGLTTAAATACKMVGSAYGVPPSASGPLCGGLAKLAVATTEATIKGAVIAGKAIGKGTVAAGKGIGKGAKFVAYDAPKKVIGTAVTKSIDATIGHVLPKSTSKVVKKVLCLGIFCGLEGIDDYRAAYSAALADVAPSPFARARRPGPSGPNPFHRLARTPLAPVGGSVARGVLRAQRLPPRPGIRGPAFLRAS